MDAVSMIANAEGLKLRAYLCPAGKWTCGWGETEGVGPTTTWTREYADNRFCDSLTERADAVRTACTVQPTDNQLGALVSFAYNYGGWRTSTVLKCHNRGDFMSAARAFDLVCKVRDPKTKRLVVNAGLTARRKTEAALYLKPNDGELSMPQAPAVETPLRSSAITQGGAATVAVGTLSMLPQLGQQVGIVSSVTKDVRTFLTDSLGISGGVVMPSIVMILGGYIVYQRFLRRREGWV
jgi:lysozyme